MLRRRIFTAALALAGAFAGSAVAAAPAQAAWPTCTSTAIVNSSQGWTVKVPATSGGDTKCNLRRGNYDNAAVTWLQTQLNSCGTPGHWLAVDGDYGPATEAAVRANQQDLHDAGLANTVDGIYGPIWDRDSFLWRNSSGGNFQGSCDWTAWTPGNPVEG